jgi:HdeA/HdeB family
MLMGAVMRKMILSLVFVATIAPGLSHAQTVDMNRVTCSDYLAMEPDQARVFAGWMSGWFNQRQGYVWVNPAAFAENVGSVRQWCTTYPRETIMSGLERSMPQPGPMTGQQRLDMSLLTCKQYLGSKDDRRELIASWMNGYFGSAMDKPVFDFRRLANTREVISNYCRKRGAETLMSAIQKTAR